MEAVKKETKRNRVPKELIYEMRRGRPIYYRDYDKVLAGEKSLEEVVGSSKIQWLIITLILKLLLKELPSDGYEVATNEAGFKFAPRSWRNLDIAIFKKEELIKEGIDEKYVKTPPEVVIEVDTKADLRKYGDFMHYLIEKTQDLLDAGVKKVIWITTRDRKVIVAEKGKRWFITDWNDTVDVMEGIKLNVLNILKEAGYEGI